MIAYNQLIAMHAGLAKHGLQASQDIRACLVGLVSLLLCTQKEIRAKLSMQSSIPHQFWRRLILLLMLLLSLLLRRSLIFVSPVACGHPGSLLRGRHARSEGCC